MWLQRQGTTSVSVSAGLILLALVSCSAAQRRNDSAAATDGPFLLPQNPHAAHRPSISSPPPPDIVSFSSDLSPSRSDRILLALVSCSAARRRNDSAAATDGPFLLPPTNLHRPAISSPPPPDIVSLLTPGASPHASSYAALLRRPTLRLRATLFIYIYLTSC